MFFASPIWLFGLLPWAALTLYFLTGRTSEQIVPFLQLWSASATTPKPNRNFHRPPISILLLILSLFFAIFAAAAPIITTPADPFAQIAPQGPVFDIGIAEVAARSDPTAQLMVKLRNRSPHKSTTVKITSGSQTLTRILQLPSVNQTQSYFLDFPIPFADTISFQIDDPGSSPVNDQAWLVRETAFPKIEPRIPLPGSLTRMIEIYSKLRPPTANSPPLAITDQYTPTNEPGLCIVTNDIPSQTTTAASASPHPLTQNIATWPLIANATQKPPRDFIPLVTQNKSTLLAVHETAPRQIWVNLDLESWSRSSDFVVFFSNCFHWLSGDSQYTAHPISQIPQSWIRIAGSSQPLGPGLFRKPDGSLYAMNAADILWPPPATTSAPSLHFPPISSQSKSLQPYLCLLALACICIAFVIF